MLSKAILGKSRPMALAMFLIIAALSITPLAGCVDQGSSATATPQPAVTTPGVGTTSATATTKAPAANKEVVIGYSGPLSGAAAEYGKDCLNGLDMAVNEINEAGGIDVGNTKVKFKLQSLDDAADPSAAVNNARRLQSQSKALAVFNPVFTSIAPTMGINEETGNEFIMMAYTSTPKTSEMGNKLSIQIPPPFSVYTKVYTERALARGWKKGAMVITLGAYGDDWRKLFKSTWEAAGGTITADKPANYYTETDFSAPLSAALATNPDFLLVGGPSDPTALVIEQARGLGFKGGFMLIDQAKMDVIAKALKGFDKLENTMGVVAVTEANTAAAPAFIKRYEEKYKTMATWEAVHNYAGMNMLAKAMVAAGTADDLKAIRTAFPKAFPLLGDKYPSEYFDISAAGHVHLMSGVQEVKNGKYTPPEYYVWWAQSQDEFDKVKKASTTDPSLIRWLK